MFDDPIEKFADIFTSLDKMKGGGKSDYDDLFEKHGKTYDVDPDLLRAMTQQESTFNPKAKSPKGAGGLMQIMPGTAKRLGVKNVYDPDQNIEGGAKYMRQLLDMFDNDVPLSLAGYNAGEGAVQKHGNKIPPYKETQGYVKKITSSYSGTGRYQGTKPSADISKFADIFASLDKMSPDDKPVAPVTPTVEGNKPLVRPGEPLAPDAPIQTDDYDRRNLAGVVGIPDVSELEGLGEDIKAGVAKPENWDLQKRFNAEKAKDPTLTVERFNQTLQTENEAANAKAKADWLAKNPEYAKYATDNKLDPFDKAVQDGWVAAQQEQQKFDSQRRQKAQRAGSAVSRSAKTSNGARTPNYDFIAKGELVIPGDVGKPPERFVFDKADQQGVAKGEYRLKDENGETFIFSPELIGTDKEKDSFVDEADRTILETIQLPIPGRNADASMSRRTMALTLADAIAEKNNLPKRDVVDYFVAAGFSDFETGQDRPESWYANNLGDPLSGTTEEERPFHLTQRTLNRITAFSKSRAESTAKYEAANQSYSSAGDDPIVSDIKARQDAGWMSPEAAEKNLAFYEAKKKEFADDAKAPWYAKWFLDALAPEGEDYDSAAGKEVGNIHFKSFMDDIMTQYGSLPAFVAEQDRIAKLPKAERAIEAVRSFVAVIPKTLGALSKSIAIAGYMPALDSAQGKKSNIKDNLFWEAGKMWDELGDWGINREAHAAWESKAADTIAQVAVVAAAAWATKGIGLSSAIGLSQGASQATETAMNEGATPDQQLAMGIVGAAGTMPDLLLMKGWFRAFTGQARVGLVKKLGQSIFKEAVLKGATSAEASALGKLAQKAFVTRAGQLGHKILFNVEKEVFKPLTAATGARIVRVGTVKESGQEWSENDVNLVGKKYIYKPEITWKDIISISDEDIESMKYGALGGAFGGTIEIASHPDAFKSYKTRNAAYDAIDKGMARLALNESDGKITLGGQTFEVTDRARDIAEKYRANHAELDKTLKSVADIKHQSRKAKTFADKRKLVTQLQEARAEIGRLSTERADIASQFVDDIGAGDALARTIVSEPGKVKIQPAAKPLAPVTDAATQETQAEIPLKVAPAYVPEQPLDETRVKKEIEPQVSLEGNKDTKKAKSNIIPPAKVEPSAPVEASGAVNKDIVTPEPPVSVAPSELFNEEEHTAFKTALSLPLLPEKKLNGKMKITVTSPSGRSMTKETTIKERQAYIEKKGTILQKLADCINRG